MSRAISYSNVPGQKTIREIPWKAKVQGKKTPAGETSEIPTYRVRQDQNNPLWLSLCGSPYFNVAFIRRLHPNNNETE